MSEVFDEDTGEFRKRTLSNWQVLGFISRYWRRRPGRFFGTIGFTLVAIGFESMMPRASEALVDATRRVPASAHVAWQAWLSSWASIWPTR
jgi:ATP-binding cassette subfamily B protein